MGNEVWGTGGSNAGISAQTSKADIRNNAVWGNYVGISARNTLVTGNRAWGNTYGISAENAQVTGNRVYSNTNGIRRWAATRGWKAT